MYIIARKHLVSAPIEVTAIGSDDVLITYSLDGMVFAAVPTLSPTGFTLVRSAVGTSSAVFRKTVQ